MAVRVSLFAIPLCLAACIVSPGCYSPKDQAQSEIANVSDRAKSIETRLGQMQAHVLTIMPAPDAILDQMIADSLADSREIQKATGRAAVAVGNTVDPEPRWAKALRQLVLLGLIGGGIYLLVYLAPILKPLLNLVGLAIPKVTKMDAKFDAEAIVTNTATPSQRESIAANRVADRTYDREFRRQKAKAERTLTANPPPVGPDGKGN